MRQSHPAIRCDTDHISENQRSWSEMPRSADMEQVKELLSIIQVVKTNGGLVALSFIAHRVQPCKDRAHPSFEFKGETDGTREMLWRSGLQSYSLRLPHSRCQGFKTL